MKRVLLCGFLLHVTFKVAKNCGSSILQKRNAVPVLHDEKQWRHRRRNAGGLVLRSADSERRQSIVLQ